MENNLLLFGSYAVGDFDSSSDIDMLTIINDYTNTIEIGKINLVCYNEKKLIDISQKGSLFILHLIKEGKIIYDPNNLFSNKIFSQFELKKSYENERQFSYRFVKNLIARYTDFKNYHIVHKAISWSVRTVIASIAAERGDALFSRSSILKSYGKIAMNLIKIKKDKKPNFYLAYKCFQFIEQNINIDNSIEINQDLKDYENKVILKSLGDINTNFDAY